MKLYTLKAISASIAITLFWCSSAPAAEGTCNPTWHDGFLEQEYTGRMEIAGKWVRYQIQSVATPARLKQKVSQPSNGRMFVFGFGDKTGYYHDPQGGKHNSPKIYDEMNIPDGGTVVQIKITANEHSIAKKEYTNVTAVFGFTLGIKVGDGNSDESMKLQERFRSFAKELESKSKRPVAEPVSCGR